MHPRVNETAMITVRAKTLFRKNIPGRTEWSNLSLEKHVAAFRPKNDHLVVWHFSRTIFESEIYFYHTTAAMRLIEENGLCVTLYKLGSLCG